MQTSIEWLAEQYKKCGVLTEERLKKAIEMHKQEIINAWSKGYDEDDRASSNPLNYYQETFKKD